MQFMNWLKSFGACRIPSQQRRVARFHHTSEQLEIRALLSGISGGTGTFAAAEPVQVAFKNVAVGDVDSDGDLDLLGLSTTGEMSVLLNDGTGTFSNNGQNIIISNASDVALGDLDGDGDLDAFVARSSFSSSPYTEGMPNQIWLNDGEGQFADSLQRLGTAEFGKSQSAAVELGDVDGDGDLDAFVVGYFNKPDEVWLNDGQGAFSDSGQRLGTRNDDVALGDLDGDGDLDAFVGGTATIWDNNGSGVFTRTTSKNWNAYDIALGDIDTDGDLDVLVGYSGISVFKNSGNSQLTLQGVSSSFDDSATKLAVGDLDGDGDLDLFSATFGQTNNIFLNDGNGRFLQSAQVFPNTASESFHFDRDVEAGDFDGDGDLDVLVADGETLQFFFNVNEPPEVILPDGGGSYELLKSGDDFVLRIAGGAEIARAKLGDATQLVIRGSDGNDSLTVNLSGGNPIRAGGITFEGGAGDDVLVLTGGAATNLIHWFTDIANGRVNLDGRTIKHSGLVSITDQLTATNRSFLFGGGNDDVTLSDNVVASDAISRLVLAGGPTLDFKKPSVAFTIDAGSGDDTVTLSGADALLTRTAAVFGGAGNDVLVGLMASDSLNGGAGDDVLNGRGGNDTLIGGDGDDTLIGGGGHDSLSGGSDDDKLVGQAGNDLLDGGLGDDCLLGDAGRDSLLGGDGNDTLFGDEGNDTLFGNAGRDALLGGEGNDQLDGGEDNDWLTGEDGNDSLLGSSGNDVIYGGTGRDTLFGGDGDDRMLGGSNNDVLLGGLGNDSLDGGLGQDTLAGNDGDNLIVGLPSEIDEAFSP